MSPETVQTPSSTAAAAGPAPAPAGGVPLAPRSRRGDHLLVAAVGACLAPFTLLLVPMVAWLITHGRLGLAVAGLAAGLVIWTGAQALFAWRSSLGGLISGALALALQIAVILMPGAVGAPGFEGVQMLLPTGILLIIPGLFLGGAWGMRRARRAGRAEARVSVHLGQRDKTMGETPSAPPSRRRDHIVSFPYTMGAIAAALSLLQFGYAGLVTEGGSGRWISALAAFLLIVAAAAGTGRSTLGVRVTGPLLVLMGMPAFLASVRPGLPGQGVVRRWLPDDPTAMTLVATGLLLMALGWGVHLARRQGRVTELAALRAHAPATPALGIPHPAGSGS